MTDPITAWCKLASAGDVDALDSRTAYSAWLEKVMQSCASGPCHSCVSSPVFGSAERLRNHSYRKSRVRFGALVAAIA